VPQPAHPRPRRARLGATQQRARLDLRLRAVSRRGVGRRARRDPAPRARRRVARRDRACGPPAPLAHYERVSREPRAPRTAPRIPDDEEHPMSQHTRSLPEHLPERIRHYIDGAILDSADGATFDVLDPVTNETYIQAAAGSAADIDAAVAAARRAFEAGPWPRMLPRERSRVLHRIADIVESRDHQLAEMESFDSGLP